jgi:hypothetical protein
MPASRSLIDFALDRVIKPGPGVRPMALDRLFGLTGERGNLRHGQPGEETELEDPCLVRMQPGQPGQVIVQDQMIDGLVAWSLELVASLCSASPGSRR